ncbi:MAG: hypothetical protein JEY94_07440 [Melioribacteraceae bacterium]|nr:hypothetical protein [Melioribacteraceae bacterium]
MVPVTDKGNNFISAKDKSINKYLHQFADYYGFPVEVLYEYKYLVKKTDILFVHKNWETNNPGLFMKIGRKFCIVDRNDRAQLQSFAVPIIQNHFTKNIIELSEQDDIKKYFIGGTIKKKYDSFGQKVIRINGKIIGTAVSHKDGLKSQYPKTLRSHEIIIPK